MCRPWCRQIEVPEWLLRNAEIKVCVCVCVQLLREIQWREGWCREGWRDEGEKIRALQEVTVEKDERFYDEVIDILFCPVSITPLTFPTPQKDAMLKCKIKGSELFLKTQASMKDCWTASQEGGDERKEEQNTKCFAIHPTHVNRSSNWTSLKIQTQILADPSWKV